MYSKQGDRVELTGLFDVVRTEVKRQQRVRKYRAYSLPLFVVLSLSTIQALGGTSWRDESQRSTLENDTLVARFQSGLLVGLKDKISGNKLLSIDPADLPAIIPLFGPIAFDLDAASINQNKLPGTLSCLLKGADGTEWEMQWVLEGRKGGDLILRTSARTASPVEQFQIPFRSCDISDHSLVWISNYGAGHVHRAPWSGALGDVANGISRSYLQPIVALFEGEARGWFVEGREEKIGPANITVQGRGDTVDLSLSRGYAVPTAEPAMYEIRFRTYRDHWEDAVDPYVQWMEEGAGFVPLEKKSPAWVKDIQAQSYIRIGDFKSLEKLASRVDPARTILGRMVGWRVHPMDLEYPDYRVNETAKRWFRLARELGFHVGAHFNTAGVSNTNKELLERFHRGFQVTGTDEDGNPTYYELADPGRHRYCSTALKDWREYLIEQIREAVEVGVDMIYIDESMAGTGAFYLDGMTAIEGVMTLEKEIMEAYPGVAVETEQFNPMASRHAAFALSQMPLGHPLSGYIFHRFIHILPEGYTSMPTDVDMLDAVQSWGFMLPGGGMTESWIEISHAFQKYELKPDSRLPRTSFRTFETHPSHGIAPVDDIRMPPEGIRLFGYRGKGGVTAYYEKHPTRRGLVIYEPGKEPMWVGTRITGVTSWQGSPVVEEVTPGVTEEVADWMMYDGEKVLGLNPAKTYRIDESKTMSPDRFHLTAIPDDFQMHFDGDLRIAPVHQSEDRSFYMLTFTGNGVIDMRVPDDTLVFLNGEAVSVDRQKAKASAEIAATDENLGVLIAFRRIDRELSGPWGDLPWQTSLLQRSFYLGRHQILDYSTEGPVRKLRDTNGFYTHVTGTGVLIGRLPEAGSIRLQGGYGMRDESIITDGDAVIRINGKELMRVPAGDRPYKVHSFDVDVTSYAGQYVMLEFLSDGRVHGPTAADWYNPWIVVDSKVMEKQPTDQLEIIENL